MSAPSTRVFRFFEAVKMTCGLMSGVQIQLGLKIRNDESGI